MPLKVTMLTPIDAVGFAIGTARQALDMARRLHRAGVERARISDDGGKTLTEEQLELLSQHEPED